MPKKPVKIAKLEKNGVYALVGFPFSYLKATKGREVIENAANKTFRAVKKLNKKSETEKLTIAEGQQLKRLKALQTEHKEAFKQYRDKNLAELLLGPVTKGVFPTKRAAKDTITKYPAAISEFGYYDIYLIEFIPFGFDAFDDTDGLWFKASAHQNPTKVVYREIRKPQFLKNIIGFSR